MSITALYKSLLLFAIVLISAVIYHNIWVNGKMDKAVDAYKTKVSVATNQQVKKDVKSLQDAFNNSSSAIRARAARWVQHEPSKANSGDRLLSTEGNPTTSKARGGSDGAVNIRGQPLLLDSEIEFIRKHADLLQDRE